MFCTITNKMRLIVSRFLAKVILKQFLLIVKIKKTKYIKAK